MEDTEETTEKVRIRDKKPTELTVGDNLKINAVALALGASVVVGIKVVPKAASATRDKFQSWKLRRELKKINDEIEEEDD